MSYVRDGAQRPMVQIPVPGLRQNHGLGAVIKRVTGAMGIQPCPPCQKRAQWLDRRLGFRPMRRS